MSRGAGSGLEQLQNLLELQKYSSEASPQVQGAEVKRSHLLHDCICRKSPEQARPQTQNGARAGAGRGGQGAGFWAGLGGGGGGGQVLLR